MRTGTTLDAVRHGQVRLAVKRFAASRADRMIASRSGHYCEVLEPDGIACGQPAYAEGTSPDGATVHACPMHDQELT